MKDWIKAREIIAKALDELNVPASHTMTAAASILARLAQADLLVVFANDIVFKSDLPKEQIIP